jgi:hypothetical protein
MTSKSDIPEKELPVVEIRVSKAWIRFIQYCKTSFPFGNITVKIVNGQPTRRIHAEPDIRFDKENTFPSNFEDE